MALLELENVNAFYGRVQALHGVSMKVEEGEIVALLGSNGAGKSTTLKTISGLLRPQMGSVTLGGRSIGGLPAHAVARLGVGHVPEGRRIFKSLTVLENLKMGTYPCPPAERASTFKENLDYVFALFPRLKERRNQRGGTLSGGEQQMLAIGRALMMNPRILLLDEPSMGLAPLLVDQIFDSILELNQKKGLTILLVEQNANQALRIASRGYILQVGSIALEGTAQGLRSDEGVRKTYLGEE